MALRAKKPVVQQARFQAVIYANRGVGKTHFCCSLPDVYYIDTEGVEKYPHFVKMILANNGDLVRLNEISEIIKEVKELLSTKHQYKTLVIDSITFPFHLLANLEAERIIRASKKESVEGTEFGVNMAKGKRLTFELGMLLTRLDMNVVVVAHEKTKYEKGEEIGKASDVSDKLEYALGTVLNLKRHGDNVKCVVEKSRYTEIKNFEVLDFNDGYKSLVERFGSNIFTREVNIEELATKEQIQEITRLITELSIPEEKIQKMIANARASTLDQLSREQAQKAIEFFKAKIIKGDDSA